MRILLMLKINTLALLCIPLLVISVIGKLCAKAFDNLLVFIGVAAGSAGLIFVIELVKYLGSEGFYAIFFVIIFIIIFGVILYFLLIVATGVITAVSLALAGILNIIFDKSLTGYYKLYDICKTDYKNFTDGRIKGLFGLLCLFWSLLNAINYITIKLLSIAYPLSIAAFLAVVGYSLWFLQKTITDTFGIGIFDYLGLFSVSDIVFVALYFFLFLVSTCIILITLGKQWSSWGKVFRRSTADYDQNRDFLDNQLLSLDSVIVYSIGVGKRQERCQQDLQKYYEMITDYTDFRLQVDTALNIKKDAPLKGALSEYVNLLTVLQEKMKAYDSEIPSDDFEKSLSPLINTAETLSKSIAKRVLEILSLPASAPALDKGTDFFIGCNSDDDVKKRYKNLVKTFHPDVGGDHETFASIQNQYEARVEYPT